MTSSLNGVNLIDNTHIGILTSPSTRRVDFVTCIISDFILNKYIKPTWLTGNCSAAIQTVLFYTEQTAEMKLVIIDSIQKISVCFGV